MPPQLRRNTSIEAYGRIYTRSKNNIVNSFECLTITTIEHVHSTVANIEESIQGSHKIFFNIQNYGQLLFN